MKNTNKIEVPLLQHAASPTEAVITMSSLGNLGRFGNQIFQYAFLKICAQESGSRVECSPWIGQTLFGHNDPPISKRLPPAIERWDVGKIVFDIVPEAIFYIEKQAGAQSYRVGAEALEHGLANVDLWGFFQVHTRFLRPYKNYFQSLFQPVSELRSPLEDALSFIRSKGRTVIGIHIRRKDFITSPQIGFTLVVPSSWWCDWLDENWSKFESPVLFLCSDDLDSIIDEFKRFSPVTSRELQVKLPKEKEGLDLAFYTDFFILSNCDVVGISNSSFSFAASMLNQHGKMFVRPHWDFSTRFTVFDPWNSEPLLYVGGDKPKSLKSFKEILYITYITQGVFEVLKFLLFYFPKGLIMQSAIHIYMGYNIEGISGVIKSLFYILKGRNYWKELYRKREISKI